MPRSLARNVRVSHASFIHVQPGRRSKSWSTVSNSNHIEKLERTYKCSNSTALQFHSRVETCLNSTLSEPSIAACSCSCLLALRRRGDADCWVAARNFITSAHLLSTAIARLLLGHDRLMAAQVVVTWRCNARAAHLSMGCSRVFYHRLRGCCNAMMATSGCASRCAVHTARMLLGAPKQLRGEAKGVL